MQQFILRQILIFARWPTGGLSFCLEKKQTINSWKRHTLWNSVLSYERNRWEFEHVNEE